MDALVVGAGPVGLAAACELTRHGLAVRFVDKLGHPTDESRAIVVHARSLEMFDRMGVAEQIIDAGIKTRHMRMYSGGAELAHLDLDHVDSSFPFSVTIAQTETERVLTERLLALGGTLERGVELTGLTQDPDAAHVRLRHGDGTVEQADVPWVVGADGGHSTVRELVGTRLHGSFRGERFLLGDVEAEHHLDPDSMYTYFSPDGPLLVFPMRGSRVRLIAQVHDPAGQALDASPDQARLQRIVDDRGGALTILRSHWLTEFDIHHAQVPAYRFGRAFLAGDAAHIHSPAGGQGMNTGMQDSFNLAWKLAASAQGRGGELLLDSYQAERHPVAAKVIELTTKLTHIGTLHGELAIRLRNEFVHAASALAPIRQAIANQTEEVDLAYRHSPVVDGEHPHHLRVVPGDHAPRIPDANVQEKLQAVARIDGAAHLVLTVSPDAAVSSAAPVAPATGQPAATGQPVATGRAVEVLVSADGGNVPGYRAVVADPAGAFAQRYGLRSAGWVVIRPDGYVGAVTNQPEQVVEYFARLER